MIDLRPDRWRIRGRSGAFCWGDRYAVACEASRVTDDLVVLTGMVGAAYVGMRSEIGASLKALGFKRVLWEDAEGRTHEQDLARF